jgi:DNA segregation ATPase FtsK/SpoIIIE, S-DNA-T family
VRLLVTAHDSVTDRCVNVFLDVDPTTRLREVFPMLVNVVAADMSGATFGAVVDGHVVDLDLAVRECGLRDGSWVTLLGPGWHPSLRPKVSFVDSTLQVRIVSGERAGEVFHCSAGELTVGTASDAVIQIADPKARELELTLSISDAGDVTAIPANDECVALLRGAAVTEVTELSIGDQLVFERCILEIAPPGGEAAAVEPDPDTGVLKYNRPPRILPPEKEPVFHLPSVPEEPIRAPLPIVQSLMPLLMGAVMALLFKNPRMLVFGFLSPIMMVSSYMTSRKFGRKKFLKQTADYEAHKVKVETDAKQALIDERELRRFACPDPAGLAQIAVGPTPRLWERREIDPLWLELRFGTATQPSAVTLEDPEELEHRRLRKWDVLNTPASVNLRQVGLVGIAGDDDRARWAAQWAVAQLAVLHSPRDVQIYLLASQDHTNRATNASSWDFVTWLPHTRPVLGQACLRTVGMSAQSLAQRISELGQILDSRADGLKQNSSAVWSGSSIVVVIDGSHRLRSMPGIVRILRDGPRVGIYSLCLDIEERLLPEECDTVVVIGEQDLTIRRQREAALVGVMPDWVCADWLDWVARAIAPIEDTSPSVSDAAIPASSRLLDVVKLDPPTPQAIQGRWVLNPRSTRAVVGESLDGAFSMDISADGPHGLVAGTTGSGKSELLQTLVAGLAIANTPESMTFVLVDYKGGAAFKDCVNLPHTVGMVTDLDPHLVERALDSLGAELKWREHALAASGAKDLEDYIDLSARRSDLVKIPRLLIVIDEFASLARELPNFVSGLVNVAQRGRSLGIHLILATQRPGGVVSPEIRANTNLRIALRVTGSGESTDVIDSPEAGNISKSTPGRAYVRLGSNSLIPFQAGRVGGRAPNYELDAQVQVIEPLIRPLSFHELAEPEPARKQVKKADGDVEVTDLRVLVDAIRGANELMGIAPQRKPWLPALSDQVSLESVYRGFEQAFSAERPEIWFGIQDLPKEQKQRALGLAPDDCGHLFVVGAARTGKTSTLRSIAVSGGQTFSTGDVHFYGIDCGNGGLLPLQSLPHVGTVVQRHQVDQVSRLLTKLRSELARRQGLLAAGGYSDIAELRRAVTGEERPAQIFVLLDSWDGFLNALEDAEGGRLVETVQFLLREGPSSGIHMVISGDRQLITGRMSVLSEDKLVFRLVERSDFSSIGVNPRSLPDEIADGRAFSADGGLETQIALVATGLTSQEQAGYIRDIGAALVQRDAQVPRANRPFNVEEMPTRFTYQQAAEKYQLLEQAPGDVFLGVGGEDIEPLSTNLRAGAPTFVIAGPPKSGRSTALAAIAHSALRSGYDLVIAAPRLSPLRELDGHQNVRALFTDAEALTEEALAPLLVGTHKPVLFLADDADLLRSIEADMWLRTVIPHAAGTGVSFVVAGDTESLGKGFTGWLIEVRKNRQGILFRPEAMTDGDVVGTRLKRSDVGVDLPLGRGHFQSATGTLAMIQTPHVQHPREGLPT